MEDNYHSYLKSLSKAELVKLIYKPFEISHPCLKKSTRTIALRISYDGRNYHGVQCHRTIMSVGECLQNALEITGLGGGIVFCGRTDAGVSAINMVVSIEATSRLETPNRSFELVESDYDEYPYDVMLNRVLPSDIRITGWAPAADEFNARYDCVQRHYKYYFVLGEMDLDLMKEAASAILKLDNFYGLSTHSNPKAVYERKLDELTINKVKMGSFDYLVSEGIKTNKISEESEALADKQEIDTPTLYNKESMSYYRNNALQHELQKARTKSLRMQHNQKIKEPRLIKDDLYCLDIKASGFLHNMVRKIYWAIQNRGKGNKLVLENVEIADADSLVFVGCKFKTGLNFIGNKYSHQQFKSEADKSRIAAAISQLRYQIFDRSGEEVE